MERHAHTERMFEPQGVPLLLGMLLSTSLSIGLWLVVSYVSWLVLR